METLCRFAVVRLLAVSVCLPACGGAEIDGQTLYLERHDDGNTFACATCHALSEPAEDGLIRPGHPIGDASNRASYKNGELTEFLDAVNVCRTEWMNAAAWSPDSADWTKLRDFLTEQAPAGPAQNVEIAIVSPPANLAGGDPARGQELFNGRCIVCHGEDAVGTERAPQLAGLMLDLDYIARRVRTSGMTDSIVYDGLTGGRMPFWGADRLADGELIDIAAWVQVSMPPATTGPGGGPGGPLRECDATHSRIGQTATLTTRFHGVTGRAVIVDDCTIRFEMFNFDGQGIDVRMYGAPSVSLLNQQGFAFGPDLRKSDGYENDTFVVQIEEGQSLDNLGAVSVWCVPVGQSFGDGTFAP